MNKAVQVRLEKILGSKRAHTANQFVKYFAVALVGYGFDIGTLILLHQGLQVHYLLAAAAGFVVGLIVNYYLSSKYVFKDSKLKSRTAEFAMFGVIGLIGLGVLSAGMWVLVTLLGVQYLLAKVLATVLVYIWNFIGRKALYRS